MRYGDPLGGGSWYGINLQWVLTHYHDTPPNDECVLYPGPINQYGYGCPLTINKRRVAPHVYATELRDGPCPPDMECLHGSCNNPLCIRHTHWGTHAENAADTIRDGTSRRNKQTRSKLTDDDVFEIRRLAATGLQFVVIAKQFGVDPKAISGIAKNKSWSWL